MQHNRTKSQVLSVDAEMAIRQVILNGIPCWQSQSGRTFPLVAGAEDPPVGANTDTTGDDGDEHADESADDYDKDRAFKTIQKLRTAEKAAKDAAKAAAKERDELKARQKKADDEQLTETERLRQRTAELERTASEKDRELQEIRNQTAIERAASKAGIADPEDAYLLLKPADFEHDDEGRITNADDLVKALLKAKPYLAGKASSGTTTGVPASPRSNGTISRDEQVNKNKDELRGSPHYQPLG